MIIKREISNTHLNTNYNIKNYLFIKKQVKFIDDIEISNEIKDDFILGEKTFENHFPFGNQLDNLNEDTSIDTQLYYTNITNHKESKRDNINNNQNIQKSQNSQNSQNIQNQEIVHIQSNQQNTPEVQNNNKKQYFLIKKFNRGRRKKSKKYRKKPLHGKYQKDNIIRKVKIHFQDSVVNYINKKYASFLKNRGMKETTLLYKLEPSFTKYLIRREEQKFLSKKLIEILKGKISKKCTLHKEDENKENIEELIKQNEAVEIIEFINKTVEEVYEIYFGKYYKIQMFNLKLI